jgi:23S rRNA pseudouridine2605 synthase
MQSEAGGVRLQKLLASAGLGSRREIERWITAGRVTLAGRIARLGDRVSPGEAVMLDGRPLALRVPGLAARVIAYHKPEGELVTRSDPQGRRTVFDGLPPPRSGRWIAVGRLDLNSSGLILFTDSGELANRLMHPRYRVEREYAVRVLGELSAEARGRLLAGIRLEDGTARFDRLEPVGDPRPRAANRWYRVVLAEGRRREVRRLIEAVGARVSRLRRVRYGPISLPPDLQPGRWRELSRHEVRRLQDPPADVVRVPKSC